MCPTLKKRVVIHHSKPKQYAHTTTDTIASLPPQNPPITIWIHGTRFIRRPLFHGFFKGVPSLRLAQELANDYYLHHVAASLHQADPQAFPLETFYLFGWSGKLNATEREHAAQILYQELNRIISEYRQTHDTNPYIRIITHSHGGNIALNLTKFKSDNPNFSIDELILLACPVQGNTKDYIGDEIFKKTYSLYSSLDIAQVLAPQLVHRIHKTKRGHIRSEINWPPLSKRRFDMNHPKLAQIKIKINGRALFHTEFSDPHFMRLLPHIIHEIDNWSNEHLQQQDNARMLCVYTNRSELKAKQILLPA